MARLAFIEHKDEIDTVVQILSKDDLVVSFQPAVYAELKRLGVNVVSTEDLFTQEGHKFVIEASNNILDQLKSFRCELGQKFNHEAFDRTFVFIFRFYINYWLALLHIIHHAVEKYSPNELLAQKPAPEYKVRSRLNGRMHLMGAVVHQYALQNNLKYQLLGADGETHVKQKDTNRYIQVLINYFCVAHYRLHAILRNPVLCPSDAYGTHKILRDLNDPKMFPVFLSIDLDKLKDQWISWFLGRFSVVPAFNNIRDKDCQHVGEVKFTECLSSTEVDKVQAEYYGVSLRKVIYVYISGAIKTELVNLWGSCDRLKRLLKAKNPELIFSREALSASYVLGEIAKQENIPAILASHGSHVAQNDKYAQSEWRWHGKTLIDTHYPYVVIQSPHAEKFFKISGNKFSRPVKTEKFLGTKTLVTSNAMRQHLYKDDSERAIILHAGTPKSWQSLRPYVYETVDEYVTNINHAIEAVSQIEGCHLAIRFRPSDWFTLNDFSELLVKDSCYEIYPNGDFLEYLISADMLLSYSSTTIEEALQNKIPVLQYDPQGKYCHVPASHCTDSGFSEISPAYFIESQNRLGIGIRWLKENHIHKIKPEQINWNEHVFSENLPDLWGCVIGTKGTQWK